MKQADRTNIINSPSPIELLWKRYETAASACEKADACLITVYTRAAADAAVDLAEASADAAYDAREDIGDEILSMPTTSAMDLAIKARLLALRCRRHGQWTEDADRFCAEVQGFGGFTSLHG